MNFKSDNISPIHPHILKAIQDANSGCENSYGHDQYSAKLKEKVSQIFEQDVEVFLVSTGGISNCLALSSLCQPYQTIYAHRNAHVNVNEGGSAESMGYKIIPINGSHNKVNPLELQSTIKATLALRPHMSKSGAISITQPTEIGTVYTLDEIKALKLFNLPIHMDGARFANALGYLGCPPKDMVQDIDVLSLGATKNGAMMGECIVFFNKDYAKDFDYRVKRAGQLTSKMRYLAAQMITYFDVWIENAAHANLQAKKLAQILSQKYTLAYPVQTNQIFFHIPEEEALDLQKKSAQFYNWESDIYRFVTHFMTSDEEINSFKTLLLDN